MGDRITMSISGDSHSDETLNRSPRRISLGDSMNFLLELIKWNFHFFFNFQITDQGTRGTTILSFYTEDATMKQTLNGACPTAQRVALSVREFTGTLQSHPFKRKGTSWVYELPTGQHLGRALYEDVIQHIYLFFSRRNVAFSYCWNVVSFSGFISL